MRFTSGAYLISGGPEDIPRLCALLEDEGIQMRLPAQAGGNPDVYIREYLHFGIDEARELRSRAGSRAIGGSRRVFIIACPGMNAEAQNALLKTLEEPPADAIFFFIVPAPETLLPTVRSRTQTLTLLESEARKGGIDTPRFLAAAPSERILMLKPLLERGKDEERDIGAVTAFLGELERALSARTKGLVEAADREGLRAVYRARKYATDKGALLKPLLEQMALLVPRRVR